MNYKEFEEMVIERVRDILGEEYIIETKDIIKNNGVKLRACIIKKMEENIAPSIYLESYYDEYVNGESIEKIADNIVDIAEKNKLSENFNTSLFTNYYEIKDKVFAKIVNRQKNAELLKNMPYREFYDLAIIMYCDVTQMCGIKASVLIKDEQLKEWNISDNEAIDNAINNSKERLGINLKKLSSYIDVDECLYCEDDNRMIYVLTNDEASYGAVCMLYEDIIRGFCEKIAHNVYIIPSSIHEILLVPATEYMDTEHLKEIIRSVNSQMPIEDILSDRAYYYSRATGYEMI